GRFSSPLKCMARRATVTASRILRTNMEDDNRRESVADALQPILEEGEQYKVFCHEGKVYVEDESTSVCAVRYPRLYGRLLAMNAQLEQAGDGVASIPTLLALTFCVGIQLQWWDLGEQFRNWWFYLLVFFILFYSISWVN